MDDLLNEFLTEAKDLIEVTDDQLVQLEKRPQDSEIINAVFRGYHTIKGGAGFLELHGLVKICHHLETLFDSLRSGIIHMNENIMNLSLIAGNEIRVAMNLYSSNPNALYEPPPNLLAQLSELSTGQSAKPSATLPTEQLPSHELAAHQDPVIKPNVQIKQTISNTHTTDSAELQTEPQTPLVKTITEKQWQDAFSLFSSPQNMNTSDHQHASSTPQHSSANIANQSEESFDPSSFFSKNNANTNPNANAKSVEKNEKDSQIKVDTYRLDAVLTLASEVGLAKNRVMAAKTKILAKEFTDQSLGDLERAVADLDRLAANLQNAVMLTRMQPIGRLFSKYPRIVRDLARTLNKKIEIEMSGQETEIDKAMIEDLGDPLIHLIRNSADHGIEEASVRKQSGKNEVGTIFLSARQEGDRIVIEIKDDGKGIDPQFIRKKAKEKHLLDHSAIDALTDQQALELIFYPGFSTAEKISSVSGRGVGMDVVKTNINKLGGEIQLSSEPSVGSTVTIRLPLTLAVLPVLLLRSADQPLALPLASVHEIVSLNEHTIQTAGGKPVLNLRGNILRLFDLAELLNWTNKTPPTVAAVVDLGNDRKIALSAQDFIGREEVMVKALDGFKPKGVSGVMIDAQGDIVLILDLKEISTQIVN